MSTERWIELDGAVNVRDLGGLPTMDGRVTAPNRLIRADNLQDLTARDVAILVDDHHVRSVADLRSGMEVAAEGDAPLHRDERVDVRHLSFFAEAGRATDAAAAEDEPHRDCEPQNAEEPRVLPWENRETPPDLGVAGVYLRYLDDRADSVVGTLRLIAQSPGATIVHCAAGKDRTGTAVALALAEVGVTREAIITDYVASAEKIHDIFARLEASPTYADDVRRRAPEQHAPRAETMRRLLDEIDRRFGGVSRWLRSHGWTDEDARALRNKLLAALPDDRVERDTGERGVA